MTLWNWNDVKEKIAQIEVGRLGMQKQITRDILPLKINFEKAINLNLQNKEKVEVASCKLIWKPFYKLSYTIKCIRFNPRKDQIVIEDSGYYLIDAVSGNILE